MHPADVWRSLDRALQGHQAPSGGVVLLNVTCDVIMTPGHITRGRSRRRRSIVAMVTLGMLSLCVAVGFIATQHSDVIYASSNNNNNDGYNGNSRVENGIFLFKPRNAELESAQKQYYFEQDSHRKRDLSSVNNHDRAAHKLDWGYDGFMKRLKIKPKCAESALLLILITSAPGNVDRRNAIRNSWCSNSAKRTVRATQDETNPELLTWHCVFLVGRENSNNDGNNGNYDYNNKNNNNRYYDNIDNAAEETNAKVRHEAQYFSDILYGDYTDTYRNLSYKVLTGLHWAQGECALKFILKTDDDCFVNVHLLPEFLLTQQVDAGVLYAGNAADQERRAHVIRDPANKWAVSRADYRPDLYPPYASGTGYILSQTVLNNMVEISRYYKPFPNEDAYVGVLADQLALGPVHSSRFTLFSDAWTVCNYRYLLVIHHVTVEQHARMLAMSAHARDECQDQTFITEWN